MKNKYLYPQEPSKPILINSCQNWVHFDHLGNKYKNKAFFEIIQTSDTIIKLSEITLLVRQ